MRKTFVVALVALLVAGVGGYFGFTFYVGHLARSQVNAVLADLRANGLKAEAGAASYDLFAGRFELRDLSIDAAQQGTLKIAAFRATGLGQPDAAHLVAKQVEIEGFAFDGPLPLAPSVAASYRAPRIDITAFEMPAETTRAGAPGTAGAMPWQIALAFFEQVKAERVAIPQSTVSTRSGAGETRIETDVTHGAARFEGLANGRFAKAVIEPSRFTVGGAPDYAGRGSVGRINAEVVDLAAMLLLLDPERRRATDRFLTVYGTVSVDGYDITTDGGLAQRWNKLTITDLAIQPSAIPAEELLAMGQRMQEHAAQGTNPSPEEIADMMRAIATVYDDGLQIGSVVFDGLEGTAADGSKASLASLKAGPLDAGRLEQISMEQLRGAEADGQNFHVARLSVGGLRPGAMMMLAADMARGTDTLSGWPAPFFNTVAKFEIDDAEVPIENGAPVTVDRLAVSWTGEPDAVPTRFSATLRMTGPTDAVSRANSAFALVPDQMQRVSVAMDLGAAWNEADGTVAVDPIYLEVSDAFSITAKLMLSDVDDSVFSPQPDEALAGAAQVNLAGLDITITDAGLYEQKLEEAAKDQGIGAAEIRQLIAGFADLLLAQAVTDRPELGPAVQAFVNFVQKPMSTLGLRITPRGETLPVMTIVEALTGDNPLDIVDELNVETLAAP